MKYVYYDPADMQVMAEFNTPYLSVQANWDAKGFLRATVPEGMVVTRDSRITSVDRDQIVSVEASVNPEQPKPRERTPLDDLHDKLGDDTITDAEVKEMLRLERGL